MLKGRVFGGKCIESLASYDHESRCWKTYQISLPWGCQMFSDRWSQSGMIVNGVLFQLNNLELPISEKGSSLLPTPTASDPDKHGTGGLTRKLTYPAGQRRFSKGDHRNKTYPTPCAHLHTETGCQAEWKRNTPTLITHFIEPDQPIGKRPRLRPQFVEYIMGFPIDWTDLEP